MCPYAYSPATTLASGTNPEPEASAEVPTFCPLHGEQHLTDVLRVVAGALDGPVQSLPAVLRVPVGPGAENTELGPQGPSRRHGGGGAPSHSYHHSSKA